MSDQKIKIDVGNISYMLGRKITGIAIKHRKPGISQVIPQRMYFMFEDGSGFSMLCTGELMACNKPESFDLFRLVSKRGNNAYDNEFLGITNPDGTGQAVLINEPLEL